MKVAPFEMGDEATVDSPEETYAVGYGKPPKKTRFKKGTSGNPGGRPKGSKNKLQGTNKKDLGALVLKEAYRELDLKEGETTVTVPVAEAVLRSVAVKAATGNQRAARLFTELLSTAEKEQSDLRFEFFKSMVEYKEGAEKEVKYREDNDLPTDDILPHPDHIYVNPRTGDAKILGPMCPEEKKLWDWAAMLRDDLIMLRDEKRKEQEAMTCKKSREKSAAKIAGYNAQIERLDIILDPFRLAEAIGIVLVPQEIGNWTTKSSTSSA